MARPPRRVYKYCVGCAALATLLWRSQAWFLFSIASYAAAFFTIVNKWLDIGLGRTEVVVRVGDNSVGTSSTASSSSAIVQPGGAATRKQKLIEWCEFRQEGSLCSTATGGSSTSNGNCTGGGHPNCKWFPRDAPVAVIFSDRLVKSGMVTMTSLCRHPTTLYVLVLMQVTSTYTPIPTEFLSCRTISMTMLDGLQYLRDTGWKPDSICDGPGRDTLGKVTQPTLLGAAHWDKDPKHASCANHLRFYLTEFPILAHHERILFVDDDVVIQQDSMKLYSHKTKPGVVFTANCDVNLWNGKCQRFDVGRSVYEHFFSQAVIPDGAWERVLALLKEASEGTISYDPKHFEWNFGFNLMSLGVSRQINMARTYERLASSMLSMRYIRGDSLVYGLGIPFLAYAGRIECYQRSGWYVLDGLGYVPPAEMEVAGVSMQTITDAPVLHYNGERKPWGTNPFAEYVKAMGYWGQNLTGLPPASNAKDQPVGDPKPLTLVVLLSGPRTGTEWLAKVMADDSNLVCGSIDDRTAPHPESLMPYDVDCDNRTQIPCLSWHVVGPKNDSCDLRLMCQWRYVLSAARGISVTPGGGGPDSGGLDSYEKAWRNWGTRRNSTSIFEGYLRRMMRLPTSAPELPCRCEFKQKVLFLKFFLGWLERPKGVRVGLEIPADYPFLRRYVEPGYVIPEEDAWYSIDARAVFRRLNARIIYLYREPIAQYLSIQRGRRSELSGSGTAWHCFEVNQSKCPAKPKSKGSDKLNINVRDAGFFVIEALRLQRQAKSFGPLFTSTFEDCVANATQCVNVIYETLGLPPRVKAVLAARVSSSLNVVSNLDELMIHRNRLAGMLVSPGILGSLFLICVIGSQPEPSAGTYGLRGQVSAGDEVWYSTQPYQDILLGEEFEMPAVLRKIRQEGRKAASGRRPQVVLYSNPRGSNPTGVDTCTSYRALEKSARGGSGALSWSEAGVLDSAIPTNYSTVVLRPPALLMAGRHGKQARPVCVIAPSHEVGAGRSESVCHVDAFPRPSTGWTKQLRNQFYFTSMLRVGDEIMTVLDASVGVGKDGGAACHVTVRRDASSARPHGEGEHGYGPTHLDAEAGVATCEQPVQYAFDYADPAASSCVERHLEHALAVGADGTWLDNMGPNLYGAKTGTGLLLGSYDLRYPISDTNPEPCPRELAAADLEGPEDLPTEAQRERETAIYKFKLCRFSAMIKAQGSRVASAVTAIHKMLGRRPLVFGNGLKHSFYWTGKEAGQVRGQYQEYMAEQSKEQGGKGGGKLGKDDMRPFAPNASENVIYYKVRGTREIMSRPNGPLDGFNMESFYGFIEVRHQCANWPIGKIENPSGKNNGEVPGLESCEAVLDHPATNFWHANVRVFANAGRRGLRALAKVGQAGWKTVGQEYLPPAALHRWSLGAYASFLFTVAKNGALGLGVHPFAQTKDRSTVVPWLHPIYFLDIGKPTHDEELIERYRVHGHSTYARPFERAIALYNPEASTDVDVPLGGEYVDPWDPTCKLVRTFTLAGQSGAVLVQLAPSRRRKSRRRR